MTAEDYFKKINEICEKELISGLELSRSLGITHSSLIRMRRFPDKCIMRTLKKLKIFVDEWEAKKQNLSVKD